MDRFQELSLGAVSELQQVFERMKEADVRPLLESIKEAPTIFVLAAGREGLSAKAFAMRLMHLGKAVHWIWDDTTPGIKAGDLMICACGSADVGHENYVAKMAKKAGAKLSLITASSQGFIMSISDEITHLPAAAYRANGDFVQTKQSMGNLFEQSLFVFFDVLVMMLQKEMQMSPQEMEKRHRNVE